VYGCDSGYTLTAHRIDSVLHCRMEATSIDIVTHSGLHLARLLPLEPSQLVGRLAVTFHDP
jgi:hypothetical protein